MATAKKKGAAHAPKKKTAKRKVSGFGKAGIEKAVSMGLGAIGGAAAAGFINSKFLGSQSDTVKGLVPIALGATVMIMVDHPIATGAGAGMMAAGGLALLKKSGLVAGMGETDDFNVHVSGVGEIETMGEIETLSGMEDDGMGEVDSDY